MTKPISSHFMLPKILLPKILLAPCSYTPGALVRQATRSSQNNVLKMPRKTAFNDTTPAFEQRLTLECNKRHNSGSGGIYIVTILSDQITHVKVASNPRRLKYGLVLIGCVNCRGVSAHARNLLLIIKRKINRMRIRYTAWFVGKIQWLNN